MALSFSFNQVSTFRASPWSGNLLPPENHDSGSLPHQIVLHSNLNGKLSLAINSTAFE